MILDVKPLRILIPDKDGKEKVIESRFSTREDIELNFEIFMSHFNGLPILKTKDPARFAQFVHENYNLPIPNPKEGELSDFVVGRNERVYAGSGIHTCATSYWNCLYSTSLLALGLEKMNVEPRIYGNFWYEPHPYVLADGKLYGFFYHELGIPKKQLEVYTDETGLDMKTTLNIDITPYGGIDGIWGLSLLEFFMPLHLNAIEQTLESGWNARMVYIDLRNKSKDFAQINSELGRLNGLLPI